MIAKLKGNIENLESNFLYLNVNEVVYEIHINLKTYLNLKTKDNLTNIELFIYHLISEKTQKLYGFLEQKEKDFFKFIISFNGIGETMAMKILSTYTIEEIYTIIKIGNIKSFEKIPKVKEKTSSKIFFEFKQRLDKMEKFIMKNKDYEKLNEKEASYYKIKDVVVNALLQLGLDKNTANEKFHLIHQEKPNLQQADDFIKEVLKNY